MVHQLSEKMYPTMRRIVFKRAFFGVAVAVSCILIAGGCRRAPRPKSQQPQVVKSFRVYSPSGIERDYAGMATADQSTNLAFKVAGQVVAFDVSEGEYITKGHIVAEINPRDYQLAYDAAKSTYAAAKSALERAQRLLERQAVSQSEFESAQNNYASALASYRNAADVLGDTRLRTPIAGIVEKKYVDTYQRVSAGQVIVRIVDPKTRTAKFTMPESGIALLENPQTQFSVMFDSYPDIWFGARLKDWVRTSADGTGVPVSLSVEPRVGYEISPGMACTVRVTAPLTSGEVVVPLTAVWSNDKDSEPKVWLIDGGRVRAVRVKLGPLYGSDMVVVTSGLSVGMEIVSAGVYKLSDGRQVAIING